MAVSALLATTPTFAQSDPQSCDSSRPDQECRTEIGSSGVVLGVSLEAQYENQRAPSTFLFFPSIGSAESPITTTKYEDDSGTENISGGFVLRFGDVSNTTVTIKEGVGIHTKKSGSDLLANDSAVYIYRYGSGGSGTNNGSTTVTAEAGTVFQGKHGIRAELSSNARDNTYTNYQSTYTVNNAGEIDVAELGVVVTQHGWAGAVDITSSGRITAGKTGIHTSRGETSTVTVAEGGEIISRGRGVHSYGRGGRTVTIAEGARVEVTEEGSDNWGVDMEIQAEPDASTNPARTLTAEQKNAEITVSGEIESRHGGVRVENNGPGTTTLTIGENGSVTGAQYGILVADSEDSGSGAADVDVSGVVSGGMEAIKVDVLASATVRLTNDFRITGGIRLNGNNNNDAIFLNVAAGRRGEMTGNIQGVDLLWKDGAGTARLDGDASLVAGSSFKINDGNLILRGHVNLGTGAFTVADGKRLTIEIGPDTDDHGRITADTITLGNQPLYVALADDARAAAAERLNSGITVFAGAGAAGTEGVPLVFDRYSSVTDETVGTNGRVQADLTALKPESAPALPDCDSAGRNVDCRTEWTENRDSSGLAVTNRRDRKSTYIATGNIGSAESPADLATAPPTAEPFYGGYVINKGNAGEIVLNNSARVYLKSSNNTPHAALLLGRSENAGGPTILTNEQDGFLNADYGIWTGWHSSKRAANAANLYDHFIRATNEGTIEARKIGVVVHHHDYFGDIEITERGAITAGEVGIQARGGDEATLTVEGSARIAAGGDGVERTGRGGGTVTVEDGATITAATADGSDKWGVDFTVDAEPNNPDRTLTAAQKSATVDVSGGIDSGHGGIQVQNDGPGTTMVTVTESGSVTGAQYGILATGSGAGTVTVDVAGTVSGTGMDAIKVEAPGATTVTLKNDFRVEGGIRLNGADDNDDLTLEVAEGMRGEVMGDINGVSTLVKNGMGTAWLGGNANFAGSSVMVNDGILILRGHVDLGDGTFTIADGKQLVIEVGPDEADHGRVTAGTFTLNNQPVHVVIVKGNAEQSLAAAQRLKQGITVFGGTGLASLSEVVVAFDDDDSITGTTVGEDGSITADLTARFTSSSDSGGSGSDGSDGTALLVVGGGALAYLLWDLGLFGAEGLPRIQSNAKGLEYQVRSLDRTAMPAADAILPASGIETSLRAHLGDGFHADLTGTPDFAASFGENALSGSRYGLGLGWQAGAFSADIGYSHAVLDSRSTFSNLAGLGLLSGRYGQRHDQLRANASLRIEKAGLSLAPSLSLYGGKVSNEGYTASSPVWLSDVPPVTREYSGWRAEVNLAPRSSLEAMGLRWRPELRLATAQIADGGGENLEIVQRDRAGAIRLQTRAQMTLPRAVHALGGGLTVAGGENWSLRGGYVAMLADGDLEHAAIAGFRMRF